MLRLPEACEKIGLSYMTTTQKMVPGTLRVGSAVPVSMMALMEVVLSVERDILKTEETKAGVSKPRRIYNVNISLTYDSLHLCRFYVHNAGLGYTSPARGFRNGVDGKSQIICQRIQGLESSIVQLR